MLIPKWSSPALPYNFYQAWRPEWHNILTMSPRRILATVIPCYVDMLCLLKRAREDGAFRQCEEFVFPTLSLLHVAQKVNFRFHQARAPFSKCPQCDFWQMKLFSTFFKQWCSSYHSSTKTRCMECQARSCLVNRFSILKCGFLQYIQGWTLGCFFNNYFSFRFCPFSLEVHFSKSEEEFLPLVQLNKISLKSQMLHDLFEKETTLLNNLHFTSTLSFIKKKNITPWKKEDGYSFFYGMLKLYQKRTYVNIQPGK